MEAGKIIEIIRSLFFIIIKIFGWKNVKWFSGLALKMALFCTIVSYGILGVILDIIRKIVGFGTMGIISDSYADSWSKKSGNSMLFEGIQLFVHIFQSVLP